MWCKQTECPFFQKNVSQKCTHTPRKSKTGPGDSEGRAFILPILISRATFYFLVQILH